MAVNPPPIQEATTDIGGKFPLVWKRWFISVTDCINTTSSTSVTGDITLPLSGGIYLCDPTSGNITVTLQAASLCTGLTYVIKKSASVANIVTVDADGSETIDGDLTQVLVGTSRPSITIYSDGTEWHII